MSLWEKLLFSYYKLCFTLCSQPLEGGQKKNKCVEKIKLRIHLFYGSAQPFLWRYCDPIALEIVGKKINKQLMIVGAYRTLSLECHKILIYFNDCLYLYPKNCYWFQFMVTLRILEVTEARLLDIRPAGR